MGGNDLILGSFESHCEAVAVHQMANSPRTHDYASLFSDCLRNDHECSNNNAKISVDADLYAVTIQDVVTSMKMSKAWNAFGKKRFSLHEWTMQTIRHNTYLKAVKDGLQKIENMKSQEHQNQSKCEKLKDLVTINVRKNEEQSLFEYTNLKGQSKSVDSKKERTKRKQRDPKKLVLNR